MNHSHLHFDGLTRSHSQETISSRVMRIVRPGQWLSRRQCAKLADVDTGSCTTKVSLLVAQGYLYEKDGTCPISNRDVKLVSCTAAQQAAWHREHSE